MVVGWRSAAKLECRERSGRRVGRERVFLTGKTKGRAAGRARGHAEACGCLDTSILMLKGTVKRSHDPRQIGVVLSRRSVAHIARKE
jgi:hypothetical protein